MAFQSIKVMKAHCLCTKMLMDICRDNFINYCNLWQHISHWSKSSSVVGHLTDSELQVKLLGKNCHNISTKFIWISRTDLNKECTKAKKTSWHNSPQKCKHIQPRAYALRIDGQSNNCLSSDTTFNIFFYHNLIESLRDCPFLESTKSRNINNV